MEELASEAVCSLGRCLSAASAWIMNDLDALAEEYDRRLRSVCGYVGMPDESRLDTAYNALLLAAAGLETGDPGLFVELVPVVTRKRMAHGVTIEAVQQAWTRLAELLEPQLPSFDTGVPATGEARGYTGEARGYTGEVSDFLWRTKSNVHVAFFEAALAQLRTAEEQLERMEESLQQLDRLTRAMSRRGWEAFWDRAGSFGYRYDPGVPAGVVPAGDFWVPEVGEAARREAFVPPAGSRSMAVAPLKAYAREVHGYAREVHGYTGEAGEFIGVLGVQDEPEDPLSPEDLELIQSVAELVAQALESTRLFEETQRRVHEANMLFNVSRALASAPLEAGEIGEIIVRQFVEVMGISEAAISLLNPKDGMLHVTADFMRADEPGARTGGSVRPVGTQVRPPQTPSVYRLSDYPATVGVMETLQPLVVQASDPNADPAELAFMHKYGRKTLVILPLAIKGHSIGILELESWDREYHYTPEQIDVAMTLANQAAVALENARLFEAAQAALAEVQATHRSYLHQVWGEHLRQPGVQEQSGLLYDQLQAGRVGDTAREISGSTIAKEAAAVEAFAGQAVTVPGLWRPEMERAVSEGGPIVVQGGNGSEEKASLAVPITLRGQTLGVIGVESPTGDRQWTKDEIALIEAVGEQLGQALEAARLFADSQRRAERERLVGEITAKIRASTDVRAILQTTAVELGQLLGTSRTLVRLTPTTAATPEDKGLETIRPARKYDGASEYND